MQVERVLESCLYVDDLPAGEKFYTDVLGLFAFSRVEDRHVFFRCGKGVFLLFNPAQTRQVNGEAPTHGAQGSGHVAFAMEEDEIACWRDHLRENGVEIEKEVSWPAGGYSIYFRDPAGNSVELATPQIWNHG